MKVIWWIQLPVLFSTLKGLHGRRATNTPLLSRIVSATSSMFDPIKDPTLYYNTEELLVADGYYAETHKVTTEDGYVLTVHRIPRPQNQRRVSKRETRRMRFHYGLSGNLSMPQPQPYSQELTKRTPVFVQHGLTLASDSWLMQGSERNLVNLLTDAGYDVWMGNARGNFYSKAHNKLDPEESKFWDFSIDEMGEHDLPAVIDYITNKTGSDSVHYIGHSMGTTMFFIMAALRPEYVKKIKTFHGLAPVSAIDEVQLSPQKKVMFTAVRRLLDTFETMRIDEVFPRVNWFPLLINAFCKKGSPFQDICGDIMMFWAGVQSKHISRNDFQRMISHVPTGNSRNTFNHYMQMFSKGRFQRYDYGKAGNLERYGVEHPPLYNLSGLNCPVSLHYSEGDYLNTLENLEQLTREIPNVVYTQKMTNYNHIDFIWAKNAKSLVYDKVLALMKQYGAETFNGEQDDLLS